MKVDRNTQEVHRTRLLAEGSRLFRARGVDGVSIAQISCAAGLTHGAFYGHFVSKAAFAKAACETATERSLQRWRGIAEQARSIDALPLDALIDGYLTLAHCEDPGSGCILSAMSGDACRHDQNYLAKALTHMLDTLVGVLTEELAHARPDMTVGERVTAAEGAFAAMHGGLVLARTVRRASGENTAAQRVLDSARRAARRALG